MSAPRIFATTTQDVALWREIVSIEDRTRGVSRSPDGGSGGSVSVRRGHGPHYRDQPSLWYVGPVCSQSESYCRPSTATLTRLAAKNQHLASSPLRTLNPAAELTASSPPRRPHRHAASAASSMRRRIGKLESTVSEAQHSQERLLSELGDIRNMILRARTAAAAP